MKTYVKSGQKVRTYTSNENILYLYKKQKSIICVKKLIGSVISETRTVSSSSNNHNFFHTDGIKKTNRKFKIYWERELLLEIWNTYEKLLCIWPIFILFHKHLDYIKTGQKATRTPLPKQPYYFMFLWILWVSH